MPPETPFNDPPASDKAALRSEIETRRGIAHKTLGELAGTAIRDHFLAAAPCIDASVIAGYWPFRTEIDPRPLMMALHARGLCIVLPVVVGKAMPLKFRLWEPEATLVKAGLGGLVPDSGAPECDPDLLLVPMLAFDHTGYRLGYGGGFYDRTLEHLRSVKSIRAVGVAYEAQRVPTIPREVTDQRLDALLTEAGITDFEGCSA